MHFACIFNYCLIIKNWRKVFSISLDMRKICHTIGTACSARFLRIQLFLLRYVLTLCNIVFCVWNVIREWWVEQEHCTLFLISHRQALLLKIELFYHYNGASQMYWVKMLGFHLAASNLAKLHCNVWVLWWWMCEVSVRCYT